jgi:hypothetical protein
MDSNSIDKDKIVDYINDYAFEFGKLFNTELDAEQMDERISEKMTLPEVFVENLAKETEIIKLKGIQEYLLQRGANDESINEQLRELQKS